MKDAFFWGRLHIEIITFFQICSKYTQKLHQNMKLQENFLEVCMNNFEEFKLKF